jgi:hypothetical protein
MPPVALQLHGAGTMSSMLRQFFPGIQVLHVVLAVLGAIGFFIFWARTRFWLPRYAHVLAIIGLIVGLWCVCNVPAAAPINKAGWTAKLLLALALPAMVYFFFVFYGGQKAAFRQKKRTAIEIAGVIEHFINGESLYPQEWSDFVECKHPNAALDSYRRRCDELDPLVNCPGARDEKALSELRRMVEELRSFPTGLS